MHVKWQALNFSRISQIETDIQTKSYGVLEVKTPLLLTDRNQTSGVCSACMENVCYEVSEKSFQREPIYSREGTMLFEESDLHYSPIATNIPSFLRMCGKLRQWKQRYSRNGTFFFEGPLN
jgi:hypothetical protein